MSALFEITKRGRRPNYSMLTTPSPGALAAGTIQFVRGIAFQEGLTADSAEPANGKAPIIGFVTQPVKVGGPDLGDSIYPGRIELPTVSGQEASFEDAEEVEVESAAYLMLSGKQVLTAVVAAGGTGYVVGDILTIAGGTVVTGQNAATLRVTAVSSGVITAVQIVDDGDYSADPTTTANAVTGGTGSGATITITLGSNAIAATTAPRTNLSFNEGRFCVAATGELSEFQLVAILTAVDSANTFRIKARRTHAQTA